MYITPAKSLRIVKKNSPNEIVYVKRTLFIQEIIKHNKDKMVSIGKVNWLQQTSVGKMNPADNNVAFTGTRVNNNGNTLQNRLDAIDRGDPTAFLSLNGTNNISATGGASSQGGTLLQRLDAIGTGELSPKYGEKNFDWNM